MCRWTARVVVSLDRREELAILPMHDPDARRLLEPLPEEERLATWHLVRRDRALVGYGAGGVELLRATRLTRPVARIVALVPDRALDRLYELVARYRSRLGRVVPDGPAPRRFP